MSSHERAGFAQSRQDWEYTQGVMQEAVDTNLDTIVDYAKKAQDEVYATRTASSEEVSRKLAKVAGMLNAKWLYRGDHFAVMGDWLAPASVSSGDGRARYKMTPAWRVAKSGDFSVFKQNHPDFGEQYTLGMTFLPNSTPDESMSSKNMIGFAELDELRLQFVQSSGERLGADIDTIRDTIAEANTRVLEITNSEDFYEKESDAQNEELQPIVNSVYSVLPPPDSVDYVALSKSPVRVMYARKPDGLGFLRSNASADSNYRADGRVLGATIIDSLAGDFDRRYRDAREMLSSTEGIGLVVDPRPMSSDRSTRGKQLVVIPWSEINPSDLEYRKID